MAPETRKSRKRATAISLLNDAMAENSRCLRENNDILREIDQTLKDMDEKLRKMTVSLSYR